MYRFSIDKVYVLVHSPEPPVASIPKQLQILPVSCQYVLSFMNFIINNPEIFRTNSPTHTVNTSNKCHSLQTSTF